MIELRWKIKSRKVKRPVSDAYGAPLMEVTEHYKILQYRTLFYPVMIASGDIVLQQKTDTEADWIDVEGGDER